MFEAARSMGARAGLGGGIMPASSLSWLPWALLSAAFAALTAIFGKVDVASINADLATLVRTVVILATLAAIVTATGQWQHPRTISPQTWLFLTLSGLATGASWLCYFRALKLGDAGRVAPIDKLSVVLVALFGVIFLGERLSGLNWLGVALIAMGALLVAVKS
jgi:transporter family protein